MPIAITRSVPPSIARCELTHLQREPIDAARARGQHAQYEAALAALGCEIRRLPDAPDLPDSVFVEDVAVVLDEVAVLTRPGAASRRPEVASAAEALRPYRRLLQIEDPATLEGGDVLRLGRELFVGESSRTNEDGIRQLRSLLEPLGYSVRVVPLSGCLHLKTAVSRVSADTLLLNPEWVDPGAFVDWRFVEVHPAEPFAANAVLVGETVLFPAAFPRTRERLAERGIPVRTVDASELARAEAGLTCCSILFEAEAP